MSGASTSSGYREAMSLDSDGNLNVNGYTMGSETFTNGALTSGTSWLATGDMSLNTNRANYTHSTGAGTLTQTQANLATAAVGSRWYDFTYTTSNVTAGTSAYIGTEFSSYRVYLNTTTAGTYSAHFKSAAAPTDFKIYVTSTAGAIRFDTLSLTEHVDGNISAMGLFTGGGSTGIKVLNTGSVGIGNTAPGYAIDVTGVVNASSGFSVGTTAGASGTFTTVDLKTVTVTNGIITSIV
jgi:hypothetical protein